MKVQPPSIPDARPVSSGTQTTAAGGSAEQRGARGAEPTADRVTLSNGASAAVARAQGEERVSRTDKLKRLEAQVRAGTYRPNPGSIAEAMLQAAELAQAFDDELGEA
ncbi:MAG: flagellar biosynthesis anti-sigma factor FlgM [Deltaproteobacteria bacterium]|nr:flagellar biosynthesis anti-sigma factor FlgM [Deltaproteobacteria bacterium]